MHTFLVCGSGFIKQDLFLFYLESILNVISALFSKFVYFHLSCLHIHQERKSLKHYW